MKSILGKKLEMEQVFKEDGTVVPVTIIKGEGDVSVFSIGEKVAVTGTSKGKGFQGVIKRHGFAGHPASHGHKDQLRTSGSIGATAPQRVLKGTRMAGRMGGEKVTVKGLEVVGIDKESGILKIKGAIPGARGTSLKIWQK